MGLFDQVLSAINDPNRQGSSAQIGQLVSTVSQLSQQAGTNPNNVNQAASILGGFVRSSLQEKRNQQGNDAVASLIREGSQSNSGMLGRLFNQGQQQQLVETISQRTGLSSSQIQMLLPVLIPVVMRLLASGETTQPNQSNNSVLSAFLDADRDGDVDLGDMLSQASKFM